MPLATKNNAIIVKDGKVAENCNCCGYCISFKSEGWSGSVNDDDTQGLFGNPINGDGWGSPTPDPNNFALPITFAWPEGNRARLRFVIQVSQATIRATVSKTSYYTGTSWQVVLESSDVSSFFAGNVVVVENVISNTVPATTDEYGRKEVDTVGRFYVRKNPLNECSCGCSPNFFDATQPVSTPDTYTLQFTNLQARPNGPRWPRPGTPYYGGFGDYRLGAYAGFMPPNDVREYFTPFVVRSGCDSYLARIGQPIVLRKVAGTFHTYLSDPINIKPCGQVRYRFDACEACVRDSDCAASPRLTVYDVSPSGWTTHPSSSIFADRPLCVWNRQQYQTTPADYQNVKNTFVYQFGNFATVSPGGTYAPEQQLLCGGTAADKLSLAEGCMGAKCPPSEVQVIVEGGQEPDFAGTYAVPRTSAFCLTGYGSFLPENYFAGARVTYSATFSRNGRNITFTVLRQSSSGFRWSVKDECGCDTRSVGLFVSWQGFGVGYEGSASTNSTRIPDTGRCMPICSDGTSESVFNRVGLQTFSINGSGFTHIGQVKIRF